MDKLRKPAESDELSISHGLNPAIALYLGVNMRKTIPERMTAIENKGKEIRESLARLGR